MSVEAGHESNRLTGRNATGDEPAILGMTAFVPIFEDKNDDKQPARTDGLFAAVPIRGALSEVLDDWEEREHRGEPRHLRRLAANHVSRDTGRLYDLNEFERALQSEIDQLVWICLRPLQDLRYDEVIQPVGRVRRPARGAAQQLSAHSEQWDRWAPDFPIPREVLASIREDDTDLYENRVVRTLVVGAQVHLNRRLQELRSHLTKNTQGRMVLLTGWHWRQERLRSSFDSQDIDTIIEMLELALAEIEDMATRLGALENSALFLGTGERSRVRSLRITNILRRDPRYRRVPPLWRLWSNAQDDDVENLKRLDNPDLSQRGMDVLAEVLTAKAIDWLGFSFDPACGRYRKGSASVALDADDGVTKMTIIDAAGSREVRLVALASPLISVDQPDPLSNARLLDDWLRSHASEIGTLAILHPSDAADIASVGHEQRTLVDHTGLDATDHLRTWALIPATPLLIDALERVTRFLRWHLNAPVLLSQAAKLNCGELDRNDRRALDGLSACRLDGKALVVREPLSSNDLQLLKDMAPRRPAGWLVDLERVDALHAVLLQCPIYPTHGKADTSFERRDNETFVCRCRRCRSEWGVNLCGACGSSIPFIRPGKAVPDGELPSDFFGGDLLASICEGAAAADVEPVDGGPDLRVLICPNCRSCSKSSRFSNCGRCSGASGSAP